MYVQVLTKKFHKIHLPFGFDMCKTVNIWDTKKQVKFTNNGRKAYKIEGKSKITREKI